MASKTKYHRAPDGSWMRCRATVRRGQGVTLCPLELDGVETVHTVGFEGIAALGGGVVKRWDGENKYRLTRISVVDDKTYVAATKKLERYYSMNGKLIPYSARNPKRTPKNEGLTAEQLAEIDAQIAAERARWTDAFTHWDDSDFKHDRDTLNAYLGALEANLVTRPSVATLSLLATLDNQPPTIARRLKKALAGISNEPIDTRAFRIQTIREANEAAQAENDAQARALERLLAWDEKKAGAVGRNFSLLTSFPEDEWLALDWRLRKPIVEEAMEEAIYNYSPKTEWGGWDRSSRALGRTFFVTDRVTGATTQKITMSESLLKHRGPAQVSDTILHESCHGHNFRGTLDAMRKENGLTIEGNYSHAVERTEGERASAVAALQAKADRSKRYKAVCPLDPSHTYYKAGMPRSSYGCGSGDCKTRPFRERTLTFVRNTED